MQMKSVSKVQFEQLNDKQFYFSRKERHKYRAIRKVIQEKKYEFLKEESKVIEKIPRLHILKPNPILYILN